MNHLTQNSVANEAKLNTAVKQCCRSLNDLKLEDRSTIQQLNGSLINAIRDVQGQIASMFRYHKTEFETLGIESSGIINTYASIVKYGVTSFAL